MYMLSGGQTGSTSVSPYLSSCSLKTSVLSQSSIDNAYQYLEATFFLFVQQLWNSGETLKSPFIS